MSEDSRSGNVVELNPEERQKTKEQTYLLRGRLKDAARRVARKQGVTVGTVIGRGIWLEEERQKAIERGGFMEIVDARGRRWIVGDFDRKQEREASE